MNFKMTVIDEMIEKARVAQKEIKYYNQEQTDAMVRAIGKTIYDHARELAEEAAEETKFGNPDAKEQKNLRFPKLMWHELKGKKSVGIIARDDVGGIIKIAHPAGVIGSIAPVTVPNILPMGNAMIALKGRNSIIISPHPKSKKSVQHTVDLMRSALKELGAPENLIQVVPEPSIEASQEVMEKADVVIATGGANLVKSAYSSGTPAFGVGAGNSQLIFEDYEDLEQFAVDTVNSRKSDNGIACISTQALIYPQKDEARIRQSLERAGAHWIDDDATVNKIRMALFDENGHFAKEFAGIDAQTVAKKAGVKIPNSACVIAVKVTKFGAAESLSAEKPCPVLSVISYCDFDEAINIAVQNYEVAGKGHTAGIYSTNEDHVLKAGIEIPVSRLMVNQSTSDVGSGVHNTIPPTNSIGCGFWGNNSISETLQYKHLLNIQRVILRIDKAPMPENVWE